LPRTVEHGYLQDMVDRAARLLVAALMATLAEISTLQAAPASDPGWVARSWQLDDGLPDNNVTGVAQTSEGYLWLSTHRGLVRFDGVRFQSIQLPDFPKGMHPLIRGMCLGREGRLWLAQEGAAADGYRPGSTNDFVSVRGLSSFRPQTVVEAGDGAIWIGYSDASACRIVDGKVTRFGARDGLEGPGYCWLASDAKGQLWFSLAGRVGLFREGRFTVKATLPQKPAGIARARAGGLWVCSANRIFTFSEKEGLIERARLVPDPERVDPWVLFEDSGGALWVGTVSSGLFRFDGTNVTRVETSHQNILSVAEDREGNIWVGTGGGGLDRLRPRVLELQSRSAGLPFQAVRSACEDSTGAMWATGENGALARQVESRWKTITAGDGWSGAPATCVAADRDGSVWIGTQLGGLCRWQNGAFSSLRRTDGLASDIVRALLCDSRGDLWIGLESGASVQRLHEGTFQTFAQPKDNPIRALAEDASGTIWMATSESLLRIDGDKLADETRHTLRPPRPIRCLYPTPDGSLWIGYAGAGVGRWRAGHFARVSTEQGLHDSYICGLTGDSAGSLWFASDHGIFQLPQAQLDAVADGRAERALARVFGRDQALPNLQANYGFAPGAGRRRDGRLWFPMSAGLAIAQPRSVQPNRVSPNVLIESMTVDGRRLDVGPTAATLTLSPGHRHLEFEFAALSFVAPENIRFRHRLEGLDETWHEEDAQRSVSYSRLPAADYTFYVTACNDDGVWSDSPARLRFRVQPFLWQTWWFRVLAGVLLCGGVAGAVTIRERRKHRRELEVIERQSLIERERARVAQDLHDDLGAGLTEIGLLGSLAQRPSSRRDQVEQHLQHITQKAREMVTSLDEIVWAIDPRHDSVVSVSHYLCEYAQQFLELTPLRCRMEVARDLPASPLDSEQRHNLFLAFKEALTNVVRHSQATEVRIAISAADRRLRVAVEDNGQGMTAAPSADGADGLANMSRRLTQLGGRCEVRSEPGKGSTVVFEFPLRTGGGDE
jgi:signal transduction histidine kinase/ligand-binding sensor domain-containing protein